MEKKYRKARQCILTLLLCLVSCFVLCMSVAAEAGTGQGDPQAVTGQEEPQPGGEQEEPQTGGEQEEPQPGGEREEPQTGGEQEELQPGGEREEPQAEDGQGKPQTLAGGFDYEAAVAGSRAEGEKPDDGKVLVSFSGDNIAIAKKKAEYVLSAGNMNRLATVTVWFEVDGDYFSGKAVKGLGGFEVLGDIEWETEGGSLWSGRVTLVNMSGGVTGKPYTDILRLTLTAGEKLGITEVRIIRIDLSGYDENDTTIFFEADIEDDTVDVEVLSYLSLYDVNRDGKVDQLDLTTAQAYYGAREGDENWNEARIADVNEDGRVDIEDLILILNHIDWTEVEEEIEEEIIEVKSIKIDSASLITLKRGTTLQLTAIIDPENATVQDITWSSNVPSLATVDENGLVTAGSKAGSVLITAAAKNGKSNSITIRITA